MKLHLFQTNLICVDYKMNHDPECWYFGYSAPYLKAPRAHICDIDSVIFNSLTIWKRETFEKISKNQIFFKNRKKSGFLQRWQRFKYTLEMHSIFYLPFENRLLLAGIMSIRWAEFGNFNAVNCSLLFLLFFLQYPS